SEEMRPFWQLRCITASLTLSTFPNTCFRCSPITTSTCATTLKAGRKRSCTLCRAIPDNSRQGKPMSQSNVAHLSLIDTPAALATAAKNVRNGVLKLKPRVLFGAVEGSSELPVDMQLHVPSSGI